MLTVEGSLVFLEHVIWVVSLNTVHSCLCILPWPHWSFLHRSFGIWRTHPSISFWRPDTTITGYILWVIKLILYHGLATLVRFHRSPPLLWVSYAVVKVSLLSVQKRVFPLICGWGLGICSLEMSDATLKTHVFALTSGRGVCFLVCLLHSVAKTGTSTWCILVSKESEWSRFQSPVQEMIHLTLYTYLPKFIWSVTVFGSMFAWCFCYLFAYLVCCLVFCPHSVMLYGDAQWVYCPTSCFCFRPPYQRYLNGDGCSNGWRGRCQQRLLLWEACWISIPICWNQEENENCASQPVNNNQRVWSSNTTPVVAEGVHAAHLAILQQGGSAGFQPRIGLQFFHSDIFVDCLHMQ